MATAVVTPRIKTVSRTKAVEMIDNNAGKFFTVTFSTKTKPERTINGLVKKDNKTRTGYIRMYSTQDKGYRSVDPRTISALKINGTVLKVK